MADPQNVAVTRQAYQKFMAGDIAGVLDLLSDDVRWRLPDIDNVPFAGRFDGRDGVAHFFEKLGASQEPVEFAPHTFIANGERVAVLGRYTWKVKPTGRTWSSEWAHIFTIDDGRITGFDEYMDTATAARAYAR